MEPCVNAGAAIALTRTSARLTRELLAGTPVRLGNLADLDPDAGEIPDIPAGDAPPPRPKKKRRPRNTVFDDHGTRPAAGG